MFEKLQKLQQRAYAPYSNFRVACILIDKSGQTYKGVNVENVAYPSGICAERGAMMAAITSGQKIKNFEAIHILGDLDDNFTSPCGACRQFMVEILEPQTAVILYKKDGQSKTFALKDLLPLAFDAKE